FAVVPDESAGLVALLLRDPVSVEHDEPEGLARLRVAGLGLEHVLIRLTRLRGESRMGGPPSKLSPAPRVVGRQLLGAIPIIVQRRAALHDVVDAVSRNPDGSVSRIDRDHLRCFLRDPAGAGACALEEDLVREQKRGRHHQEKSDERDLLQGSQSLIGSSESRSSLRKRQIGADRSIDVGEVTEKAVEAVLQLVIGSLAVLRSQPDAVVAGAEAEVLEGVPVDGGTAVAEPTVDAADGDVEVLPAQ